MKNQYLPTSLGMYVNYLVVGMSIIILPQNMDVLAQQWQTTLGGVAVVISAVGLGRMLVSLASGILSDRFGRRLFILMGASLLLVFFGGALVCHTLTGAIILATLLGVGGASLDAGTYPALMEMFPQHQSTANVTLKAFTSIGQFTLPLIISLLVARHWWYGWSFLLCLGILIVNTLFLWRWSRFPVKSTRKDKVKVATQPVVRGNLWLDGTLFAIFGYAANGVFLLASIWLTKYGQDIVGLNDTSARALISDYSVGSLTCVFLTIWLAHRGVRDIQFLIVYTVMSFSSLLVLYLFPIPLISTLMAFIIGFSAAGGVVQIGLTIMASFFPNDKGTVTGIVTTAASVASFTVNLIAGALAANLANVMLLDVGLALVGVIAATLITMRYRYLFGTGNAQTVAPKQSET
ncbi:MFS transporter [Levilactobacillus zymae]|uniref:MFS transporter n=1 Tax=Levilactobacillus zymae TaxID=267363 RepID=A0ABQ0WTT1_9LACO|nr:MFS transporter [Levilactobacillus zymae]KRL15629.1 permease [Levilactobacillus zymae DSM 19395]QFR60705.1 MFS transporter [Levilactobacillus zymae]GEO70916.1 MFS transporter [Levilactobacillus zymae]